MATESPSYHHGSLRSALLERAEQVLAETGDVGALSLRALARDVGVSHGAPRRHFRDKQALIDALAADGFVRLRAALDAGAADAAGAPFTERLAAVGRAYVRVAVEQPVLLELMFAAKHRPGADEALRTAALDALAPAGGLVAEGFASGELADKDPDRAALVLFGLLQGVAALAGSGIIEAHEAPALVDDAIPRVLRGMGPR